MNKRQFVQQRRSSWQRFEHLVLRADHSTLRSLSAEEITEYSRLLRELSSDLAVLRSRTWGAELVTYVNHLVARGHNAFYSAPPSRAADVLAFVTRGFPRVFRANIGYFAVACLLFFLPGAISWTIVQRDPAQARRMVPPAVLEQFDRMYADPDDPAGDEDDADADEEDAEDEEAWAGGFGEQRSLMFGFYIRNNVGIALQCFGLGLGLAVGTVYTLLFNGILLGGISGYVISLGHGERFLSFIVSHGSFELTAIAVAGGGGLMLGDALVHPGQRSRLASLYARGAEAVQIAAGAAVMLLVAAGIEAYWSPSPVPAQIKYVAGALLWLLVVLYLAMAGRER